MVDLNIELPENFLDEEVRCGYTVTRQMKELWAIELDLLNELIRVCDKNNLQIFASDGTLLGAVRHHGFIPWDDDVDVFMLRNDYERLKKYAYKDFDENKYFFQNTYTDNLVRPHAQLRRKNTTMLIKSDYGKKHNRGIFIDIFILDSIPDNINDRKRFLRKLNKMWKNLQQPTFKTESKYSKFIVFCYNASIIAPQLCAFQIKNILFGGIQKRFERFELEVQKYNNQNCKNVCDVSMLSALNRNFREFPIEFYQKPVYLAFEMLEIQAPYDYDKILHLQYGNYNEFRIGTSLHGHIFVDTSNDYTLYDGLTYEKFSALFKVKI